MCMKMFPNVTYCFIISAFFECAVCHSTTTVEIDRGRIAEPTVCAHCSAKYTMTLIHNRSSFTDKQMVKLQESPGMYLCIWECVCVWCVRACICSVCACSVTIGCMITHYKGSPLCGVANGGSPGIEETRQCPGSVLQANCKATHGYTTKSTLS